MKMDIDIPSGFLALKAGMVRGIPSEFLRGKALQPRPRVPEYLLRPPSKSVPGKPRDGRNIRHTDDTVFLAAVLYEITCGKRQPQYHYYVAGNRQTDRDAFSTRDGKLYALWTGKPVESLEGLRLSCRKLVESSVERVAHKVTTPFRNYARDCLADPAQCNPRMRFNNRSLSIQVLEQVNAELIVPVTDPLSDGHGILTGTDILRSHRFDGSHVWCCRCGLFPLEEDLHTWETRTPDWTWPALFGRHWYEFLCPKCLAPVHTALLAMS